MFLSGLRIVDKPIKQRDHQRGFSLLEILAALALGVLMMTSLTSMVDITLQDTKGQQTAQYQDQFTSAASRYLNDNAATLLAQTATTPTVAIPLATLKTAAYLPAGFAATNAYRQAPCMLVRSPAAGQLDALVVTEGGDDIPVKDIGYVAANAGTGGGSIGFRVATVTGPLVARGAYEAWLLDTPALNNFTSASCTTTAGLGHMASALFYGGPSAVNRDVLYRNPTPTDISLNQMNTPLGITPAAMKLVGDVCATPAITIETGTSNILTCNTGTRRWASTSSKFWGDAVASFGLLPPTGINGEVRVTTDTSRAFAFSTLTNTWKPLAVDQAGNFIVPTTLTVQGGNPATPPGDLALGAGNITTTGSLTANLMTSTTDVVAGRDLRAQRDALVQNNITAVVGTVKAPTVIATAYAEAPSYGVAFVAKGGDQCNFFRLVNGVNLLIYPIGSLIKDANGNTLMCRNAVPNPIFVYANGGTLPP